MEDWIWEDTPEVYWDAACRAFDGGRLDAYLSLTNHGNEFGEWLEAIDERWLGEFGRTAPRTLEGMLRLAGELGLSASGFEKMSRNAAVAYTEGVLRARRVAPQTGNGQPDSKADTPKEKAKFLDPPEKVRRAAKFLRDHESEPGGKAEVLLQFTNGNESEAKRLSNELKPSRYGRLLGGTRFHRTTSGQEQ